MRSCLSSSCYPGTTCSPLRSLAFQDDEDFIIKFCYPGTTSSPLRPPAFRMMRISLSSSVTLVPQPLPSVRSARPAAVKAAHSGSPPAAHVVCHQHRHTILSHSRFSSGTVHGQNGINLSAALVKVQRLFHKHRSTLLVRPSGFKIQVLLCLFPDESYGHSYAIPCASNSLGM